MNEMNPLVTVVIPSFNRARFVVDAVESVLKQSYRPIEIIVVDDGSEDDTAERLAPYIAQQQIQYHYQKNQGAAIARNYAIAQSSADYIALLDSDDLWLPQKLESQIEYLQTHPKVAMVAAHVLPIGKERNLLDDRPIFSTQQEGLVSFLNVLHHSPLHVSTLVIRRQALPSPPFPAGVHFCEDWQMCLQVARHASVWFIEEVMTHVRIHENNITVPLAPQPQLEAKLRSRLGVLHRVGELIGTDEIELSRAVAKEHADYAIASYANGECTTAQHHLSLAWKHDRPKWQGEELATQIGHFASLIFHQSGEKGSTP